MKRFFFVLMVCVALAAPSLASARTGNGIEVVFSNARDYIPAPAGTFAMINYYEYLSADTAFQDGHKAGAVDVTGNIGLFRPVYWLEAGPLVIDPQMILPVGGISLGNSTPGGTDTNFTGIGDPILFATFWLVHDKASMTYLGFTPFFTIPGGDYRLDNGLSRVLAGNRWKFQEELGFVKGFQIMPNHNLYAEVNVGGVFQTDNSDAGAPGSPKSTESTDPILKVESHLSYDLTKQMMIGADYYYQGGGKNSFDNVEEPFSNLSTSTVGGTLSYNFASGFQGMLQYKQDVSVDNGLKTQVVLFRLLYACDIDSMIGKLTK